MTAEPSDAITTTPSTDIGSERLASALAAMDVAAIGRALRNDFVIVPLTRGPGGETQTRVIAADDPEGERRWVLCIFSSTQSFSDFLAGDTNREFAIQRGTGLVPLLEAYRPLLRRVFFDPAGPHPVQASVEDVLASLQSDANDDPVAWITGAPSATLGSDETIVALDLFLPDDWATIDLTDPQQLSTDVSRLVKRQLAGLPQAPVLQIQLTRWLTSSGKAAAHAGGRVMAFLLRRTDAAAAALTLTHYWHDLGEPGGTSHLDRMAAQLAQAQSAHDDISRAQTAAGPFIRHTHRAVASDELAGPPLPLVVIDYWLASPDDRALALVSFSTPHGDALDAIRLLTDNIVLAAAWVIGPVAAPATG